MDNKEYLEEGFDPKTLKVAQLRNILSSNSVEYASNAKKSELVKLFDSKISKNRSKLLSDYNDKHAVSSEAGFIDMTKKDKDHKKTQTGVKKKKKSDKAKKDTKSKRSGNVIIDKVNEDLDEAKVSVKVTDSEVSDSRDENESSFSRDNIFQSSPRPVKRKRKHDKVTEDTTIERKVKKATKKEPHLEDTNTEKKVKKVAKKEAHVDLPKPQISTPSKLTSNSQISTPILNEVVDEPTEEEEIVDDEVVPVSSPAHKVHTPKLRSPSARSATPSATPKKSSPKKSSTKSTPQSVKATPKSPGVVVIPDEVEIVDDEPSQPSIHTPRNTGLDPDPEKPEDLTLEEEAQEFNKIFEKKNPGTKNLESPPEAPIVENSIKLTPGPKLAPKQTESNDISDSEEEGIEEEADETKTGGYAVEEEEEEGEVAERKRRVLIPIISYIFVWVFLVLSSVFLLWFREQTVLIGYCGNSIDEATFFNPSFPNVNKLSEYLDTNFKPTCVKCPAHARCFENLELGCFEDFIEQKPWYFDLAPFVNPSAKKCIPDTKKAEKVESMIQFSLDLLRSKNALVECGQGLDNIESGLSETELYNLLVSMKAPYISLEEFDELWERSVVEIEKESEIITQVPDYDVSARYPDNEEGFKKDSDKVFRSTSLQNLSLTCKLQNSVFLALYNNKYLIIGVNVVLVVLTILKIQYDSIIAEQNKISEVYDHVIEKLQAQKNTQQIKYIGSNQLRDSILHEENLKYKLKIWSRITKRVENNANVSSSLIENYGEIYKVWEWIGESD